MDAVAATVCSLRVPTCFQLQRVMQRDGCTALDARARINAQMPLQQKMQLADVVLFNNGTVVELHQQVSESGGQLLQQPTIGRQ